MADQAWNRWPSLLALFEELPLSSAMPELLPRSRRSDSTVVAASIKDLAEFPDLLAGLWLYVDDLQKSHEISQTLTGPIGAYWHGIMHRREGDFSNSKYWLRQARGIELPISGYEPTRYVDQVEQAKGSNPLDLLKIQRDEWLGLFSYCASRAGVKV